MWSTATRLFRLAAKQAWRHRRRTLLIGSCVILGNIMLLLQLGQGRGQQEAFMSNMINSLSGHIQVSKTRPGADAASLFEADPQKMAPLDELPALQEALAADPRVAASTARVRFGAMLSHDEDNWSGFIVGVQPDSERRVCAAIALDSGRFVAPGAAEIVISKTVARERGLVLGDTVTVLASTTTRSFNAVELRIVGLLADTGLGKFYSRMAYIPIEKAQSLIYLERGQAYELVLRLHDTAATGAVTAALRSRFAAGEHAAVQVRTWHDMAGLFLGILEVSKAFRIAMTVFLGLVILILVFSSFSVYVLDRAREIATLLALGLRKGELVLLFVGEAVFVAFVAAAIGLGLGAATLYWLGKTGIPAFNEAMTYVFAGERLFPILAMGDVVWLLAGSCLIAIVAALLPVRRALNADFVETLNRG